MAVLPKEVDPAADAGKAAIALDYHKAFQDSKQLHFDNLRRPTEAEEGKVLHRQLPAQFSDGAPQRRPACHAPDPVAATELRKGNLLPAAARCYNHDSPHPPPALVPERRAG